MIQLTLNQDAVARGLQVLCLGAHSDDIEIGCGGTVLRLAEQFRNCTFRWVVFSAVGPREAEARRAAALFTAAGHLHGPVLKQFRDGFMPFSGAEVKDVFESLKQSVSPDLILTHNAQDAHQDHRLISKLTWNTFRDHFILEYEIPKYDGDMGRPGVFIPLTKDQCQQKVRHLMEAFPSQRAKAWFEENTFLSLMRLRGMECNAPSGYAEAFYCRKLVL
jgi:LmbE family N-acetylglucosaminyl deacetylase